MDSVDTLPPSIISFLQKNLCLSSTTSSSRVSYFSRAKALGWKNFVQERSKMMTISDCNMILSELSDRLTNDNCKVFKSKIFTLQNWYFKTFLGRTPECIFVGMAIIKNLLLNMQFYMSKKVSGAKYIYLFFCWNEIIHIFYTIAKWLKSNNKWEKLGCTTMS